MFIEELRQLHGSPLVLEDKTHVYCIICIFVISYELNLDIQCYILIHILYLVFISLSHVHIHVCAFLKTHLFGEIKCEFSAS